MSAIGNATGASSVDYANQIAQTSSLKRSLNNLGNAIQSGNLSSAGNILTSLVKANPQFATSGSSATQTSDPINLDFKAISDAIDKNDTNAAQAAFEQLKADLAKSNITINDGTADTAKLLADNKAAINGSILANAFGTSSDSTNSLLGIGGNSSDNGGLETLVKDWITYKAGGTPQPTAPSTNGGLNVTA